MSSFDELFGFPPEAEGRAPGRVNLLGEHTDYNQGLVLPLAIPRYVHTQVARSRDGQHHFHSMQGAATRGFERYLHGCIEVARKHGNAVPPVCIRVDSEVPIGAGLSSSAALEVSTLRALRSLLDLDVDDVTLAQWAHEAEVDYAGVRCGILDQMASSLAGTDCMLFLDTRSLERRLAPLPHDAELCIVDSGLSRELAGSGYNRRRSECEEAARLLGVASLRDVNDLRATATLPPPLDRRARHVFTENQRVMRALGGIDASAFGALMNESHASLSEDYEVSTHELDALAAELQRHPSVFGAKLTGAGFGGACVALTRAGASKDVGEAVLASYSAQQPRARVLLTTRTASR
jgi:galactokinase